MIDIRKALSQRCYIIFDSNEQLVKFVSDNKLPIYIGVFDEETIIRIVPNDPDGYVTMTKEEEQNDVEFCRDFPRYHHTKLTITDDGE
jgi:hypothetical protein